MNLITNSHHFLLNFFHPLHSVLTTEVHFHIADRFYTFFLLFKSVAMTTAVKRLKTFSHFSSFHHSTAAAEQCKWMGKLCGGEDFWIIMTWNNVVMCFCELPFCGWKVMAYLKYEKSHKSMWDERLKLKG